MHVAEQSRKGNVFAVICLVAGTCIGGGMLALPVATSMSGFIPSLVIMALVCAFMATTGLYFVEASLWLDPGVHFVTMSQKLLGSVGRVVVVVLYLFIAYASLVAYTAGGGELVLLSFDMDRWLACLLFAIIFGTIIFLGNRIVGPVNALLFVGMIVAYLLLIFGGAREITGHLLLRHSWAEGIYALPLLLTIFSYQAIVPSLVVYLDGNGRRVTWGIVGGMVVAFVIYTLWQGLILGIVPFEGELGLEEALSAGASATRSFRHHVARQWISSVAEFFSFFALVTSFLGIGLGLFDFLADGLKWRDRPLGPLGLILLVIGPSLIFAIVYPQAFLIALDTSGGFGDAILNGMIPVLMVVSGRYYKKYPKNFRVWGGKILLTLIFLFAAVVLCVEIAERIHFPATTEDLR